MTKKTASLLFLLGILLAVNLPHIFSPISELDGSWYYSQAVSIANGSFFYNHYTNTTMPVFYGWLQADFALLFPNAFGIGLFYFLILAIFSFFLLAQKQYTGPVLLIATMLVLDSVMHLHRPEPVFVALGCMAYYFVSKHGAKTLWLIGLSLIGLLLHPPNGILLIAGILAYEGRLFQLTKTYLLLAMAAILLATGLYFAFPNHSFTETAIYRVDNWSINAIIKYFVYSGLTLISLIIVTWNTWDQQRIINMIALFVLCAFLGTFYYLAFLFIPLILHILNTKIEWRLPRLLYGLVCVSFLLSVVHPVFTSFENRAYGQQARSINKKLKELEVKNQLFVSSHFAPAVYDNPDVKMLLIDHRQTILVDTLDAGDIVAITSMTDVLKFRSFTKKHYPKLGYEIVEEIAPVKGKLTLQSGYQKRTEPLALYVFRF